MIDKEVHSFKDLIYYQYAKIIVKNELNLPDLEDAKERHYGFIKSTYRGFILGNKTWNEIIEFDKEHVPDGKCSYCGVAGGDVHLEYLIQFDFNIKPGCKSCEMLKSEQNQVPICSVCSKARGEYGLYEYFHKVFPNVYYYYDFIPRKLEEMYLKLIYFCHECAGTLDKGDINKDGKLDVLDIDYIIH
jgi:hypothetical protein